MRELNELNYQFLNSLFMTIINANFDEESIENQIKRMIILRDDIRKNRPRERAGRLPSPGSGSQERQARRGAENAGSRGRRGGDELEAERRGRNRGGNPGLPVRLVLMRPGG